MRPRLFIASSRERLPWANAVHSRLDRDVEVTVWDQSFRPSKFVIESLLERMDTTDFGVFIFSPDDLVEVRGARYLIARDNVVLEFGMHIGRIGRHRCFMLIPRGIDVKLPSDIDGMVPILYDDSRSDGNLEAAVTPACNAILREIANQGRVRGDAIITDWTPANPAFKPTRRSSVLAGIWLSRFDFHAVRGKKRVYGYQFDLERLDAAGSFNLTGKNIAHVSSLPNSYAHELCLAVCGSFLIGSWFNLNTTNFGATQFHISSANDRLDGMHIGNANNNQVELGAWQWIKICDANHTTSLLHEIDKLKFLPSNEVEKKFLSWYRAGGLVNIDRFMQ